jgi:hypothetical protein
MRIPTATSPFGSVTGCIPAADDHDAPHVPSSWHLEQQIEAAMRKADASRKRALEERFERAVAFNRHIAREHHENNLIQMPRKHGFKTPI